MDEALADAREKGRQIALISMDDDDLVEFIPSRIEAGTLASAMQVLGVDAQGIWRFMWQGVPVEPVQEHEIVLWEEFHG